MIVLSPPPQKIPDKILQDPELAAYFRDLTRSMYQMFFAIGGNAENKGIPTIEFVTDLDNTGKAGATTMTGQTDTPTTDPGWATSSTVDMNSPDGYLKFFNSVQAITVPFWNT